MELYRVRIQLDDTPGRLGHAAAALGELGANILDVDVQSLDGSRRADDLLIDLTVPLDLRAIELALGDVGCEVLDVRPADPHELTDPGTRGLELAHMLMVDDHWADAERVAESTRRLVRADLAWIGRAEESDADGLVGRALAQGTPVLGRAPVERLPRQSSWPWTLAVPFELCGAPRALVLVRRRPRFSFSETARVQALLRVVTTMGESNDAHGTTVSSL